MAKARTGPAKRKRIYIARKEAGGDIQISGGVAKIKLTPKVISLFVLFVASAVAIVFFAAQQGRQAAEPLAAAPAAAPQPGREAQERPAGENMPPVASSVEIVPADPTANTALTAKFSALDPEGDPVTTSLTWYVNDRAVQEGPESTLAAGKIKKGDSVRVELTASDPTGRSAALSSLPVTVRNLPPLVSSVTIDPSSPMLGAQLTAIPAASDPDGDVLTCQYLWSVNGSPSGAASPNATFPTAGLQKQDSVTVALTCGDGTAVAGPVISKPVTFGNRPPEIVSTAPDGVVNGVYTYQVVARDPDGDKLVYRLERGPAGITIDAATGLVQWTVPKGAMYTGRNEIQIKISVDDGNGGNASQEFVIVLVDYVSY